MGYQPSLEIGGYFLDYEKYQKIKSGVYEVLKKELPNEAQTVEVLSSILSQIKEDLEKLNVKL